MSERAKKEKEIWANISHIVQHEYSIARGSSSSVFSEPSEIPWSEEKQNGKGD